MPSFSDLLQLGFAGAMAFVLVGVILKLSKEVIAAFKEISASHTATLEKMEANHRMEREQCYKTHGEQLEKFDQTVRFLAENFTCHNEPKVRRRS